MKNVALRNNNTHSHHIEYNIDIGIKYRIPQNTARSSETDSIGNFFMLLLILFDLTQFFSSNNCQTFVIKLQIIGAVCLGLILSKYDHYAGFSLYFLLMVTTFLIGTFCLLISCLFSLSTGGIISKTIYVKAEYFLNLIKFSWKLKRIDWLPFLNGIFFYIRSSFTIRLLPFFFWLHQLICSLKIMTTERESSTPERANTISRLLLG